MRLSGKNRCNRARPFPTACPLYGRNRDSLFRKLLQLSVKRAFLHDRSVTQIARRTTQQPVDAPGLPSFEDIVVPRTEPVGVKRRTRLGARLHHVAAEAPSTYPIRLQNSEHGLQGKCRYFIRMRRWTLVDPAVLSTSTCVAHVATMVGTVEVLPVPT